MSTRPLKITGHEYLNHKLGTQEVLRSDINEINNLHNHEYQKVPS